MAKDPAGGFKEFVDVLKELSRAVEDPQVREEALRAWSTPIVEEAKRIAKDTSYMDHPTGNLSEGIVDKYTILDPDKIEIGWNDKAFYGVYLERGFLHYAKLKSKSFVKRPHIRPAYNKKKTEGVNAAIDVFRKHLDKIN
jgi:hypothetical protein